MAQSPLRFSSCGKIKKKLITASNEEPSKEIKCFFLQKIELTYSLTVAPSDTLGFVFIGKGRKSCGSKQTEENELMRMITPCGSRQVLNRRTVLFERHFKQTNKQQNSSRSYDVIFAVSF